jgi:hypothetical protein
MRSSVKPPDDDPPVRRPLRSDLPLLWVLLVVHLAVMISLPVAAWFTIRFVQALPAPPDLFVPVLVVVLLLVEAGLFWRARRVWERVRGVR